MNVRVQDKGSIANEGDASKLSMGKDLERCGASKRMGLGEVRGRGRRIGFGIEVEEVEEEEVQSLIELVLVAVAVAVGSRVAVVERGRIALVSGTDTSAGFERRNEVDLAFGVEIEEGVGRSVVAFVVEGMARVDRCEEEEEEVGSGNLVDSLEVGNSEVVPSKSVVAIDSNLEVTIVQSKMRPKTVGSGKRVSKGENEVSEGRVEKGDEFDKESY